METAFLIVLFSATLGGAVAMVGSGFLYESRMLYPALALLLTMATLLWLLAARPLASEASPDAALALTGSRRRIALLFLAFFATRAVNLVSRYAFSWPEEGESVPPDANDLVNQLGSVQKITGILWLVVVPLIVFLAIRWLQKRGIVLAGAGLVGPGFASMGLAWIILGLGAGNSLLRHQVSFALAEAALSMGYALIFVGLATLTCSLVSNRWRGTATALFAGVPQTGSLMTTTWHSWPLAAPLLAMGAGALLAGVLWHLFVVRGFARGLIVQKGAAGVQPGSPRD